ncbi:MAG: glycosyltransferase family 39 protein [Acidobacteriota bacterium]
MTRRTFAAVLLAIFAIASLMRIAWLRADPPTLDAVGIVWHDEGAWVHNARNRALWGTWRTDNWNPVFIAPVFTALEYGSFRAFGVGTWQARVVPVASGLLAIFALIAGLVTLVERRAALLGGALLATNYAFVMWNRAALMESTMTACIVVAWAAYASSARKPSIAAVAGVAAVAAWFTKASAAFFVAALALDATVTLVRGWQSRGHPDPGLDRRAAWWTLAGLTAAFAIVGALFVAPHWTDYQFYNWQMTVTRKPSYSLHDLAVRASWLPFVQGIFSRMWFVLLLAAVGIVGVVTRWTSARPAERLLVFWVFIGLAELVVHDSGNERRYVMFIPAFTALASMVVSWAMAAGPTTRRLLRSPALVAVVVLPLAFLVIGSAVRTVLIHQIEANDFKLAVRLSAALAVVTAALAAWLASRDRLAVRPLPVHALSTACCLLALGWNTFEYGRWVSHRTQENSDASRALGQLLPAGTVVQGKLANGMSLENRIRPIFVGNGFGNYDDRLRRDDARYILTYDLPQIGYESSVNSGLIQGILDHYPRRRVIATFVVDETPGPDRAVLIDKEPDGLPAHARD